MKSARQEILDKLKNAVHNEPEKPDFDTPVYHPIEKPLDLAFKENLEKVNGSVYLFSSETEAHSALKSFLSTYNDDRIFCSEDELKEVLSANEVAFSSAVKLPEHIEVGITGCEFLVAHTGSVMVSSVQKGGRQMFVYPPVHIIIAKKSQIVDYLEQAYAGIQKKYATNFPSQVTIITGPSRTADIEKTLILGAHGPRELHVFIY